MSYDVEAIREAVDLRALAEEAGAVFRKDSSHCPLHGESDNKTAFHIFSDGKRWQCFTRCSDPNNGDCFDFYMKWKSVDFKAAVRDLAQRAGIEPGRVRATSRGEPQPKPQPLQPLPQAPNASWQETGLKFVEYAKNELCSTELGFKALAYLQAERGLEPGTIDHFDLGYNPKDLYMARARWGLEGDKKIWLSRGVTIPGYYLDQLWYVKIRRPLAGDGLSDYISPVADDNLKAIKFAGPAGGIATLFGAITWVGLPALLLVEGEWDCMLAWQEGRGLCDVATLGGVKHKPDAADKLALARYPLVVQVSDADQAGDEARQYWTQQARVVTVQPPDHDLTDYWRAGGNLRRWIAETVGRELGQVCAELGEGCPKPWVEVVRECGEQLKVER